MEYPQWMTFIIKLTSHRCSSSRTHYLLWYLMINLEPSSSHLVFQMSVMLLLSYYFFTLLLPSYLLVLSYYFFRPLYVTLHNNKYRGSELYIPSVCACVQFVWTGRQRPALESVQYRTNQIYICSFRIWTQALSVSLNLCCMTRAQFYISPIHHSIRSQIWRSFNFFSFF